MVAIVAAIATYVAAGPALQARESAMANKHMKSVAEDNSRIAAQNATAAERAFNAANRKKPNLFSLIPGRAPVIPPPGTTIAGGTSIQPVGNNSLLG